MAQERKDNQEKIKEITEKLHNGIEDLFKSGRYKEYLDTMSKFSQYSFNNIMLIAIQRPDATAVAGYKAWEQKFDRHVQPGSKGIAIIEPVPWKKKLYETVRDEDGNPKLDENGNEIKHEVQRVVQNFKLGYVFAYEDTDGKPLPEIVSKLQGDVKDYDSIMAAIQAACPAPIVFEEIHNGANGYYDLVNDSIHVDSRLSQAMRIKTSIHEFAHREAHALTTGIDKDANRVEREVTAESVAYTVSSFLGMDTSEYSFGYVAVWSQGKELKELQAKMEVIRKTANSIISSLETELEKQQINQCDNVAFTRSNVGYLHIWKNDDHYSYELATPTYEVTSSGQLDDGSLSMSEAAHKVMDIFGTSEKFWTRCDQKEVCAKIQERFETVSSQSIGHEQTHSGPRHR